MELCRFKLKEGARLRTEYKDFYDIQTEYDTVNLAHATWAAADGNSLSKEVTDFFAGQVLACKEVEETDRQFGYLLLQGKEAVRTDVLMDYLIRKTGPKQKGDFIPEEAFYRLERVLEDIRRGGKTETIYPESAFQRLGRGTGEWCHSGNPKSYSTGLSREL